MFQKLHITDGDYGETIYRKTAGSFSPCFVWLRRVWSKTVAVQEERYSQFTLVKRRHVIVKTTCFTGNQWVLYGADIDDFRVTPGVP